MSAGDESGLFVVVDRFNTDVERLPVHKHPVNWVCLTRERVRVPLERG